MYAGQIVEQAPTKTLFAKMRMPYTSALVESIPRLENPSHTRLNVIAGRPPDLIDPPRGCRFAPRCPYVQDRCPRAQELCAVEEPQTREVAAGQFVACHYPLVGEQAPATPVEVTAAQG
jgi:peptide/nickel transport system ATP-binding protein